MATTLVSAPTTRQAMEALGLNTLRGQTVRITGYVGIGYVEVPTFTRPSRRPTSTSTGSCSSRCATRSRVDSPSRSSASCCSADLRIWRKSKIFTRTPCQVWRQGVDWCQHQNFTGSQDAGHDNDHRHRRGITRGLQRAHRNGGQLDHEHGRGLRGLLVPRRSRDHRRELAEAPSGAPFSLPQS